MIFEVSIFLLILLSLFMVNMATGFFSLRYPSIAGFYFIFFLLMAGTLIQPDEIEKYKHLPGYNNFVISLFIHAFFFLLGVLVAFNVRLRPRLIAEKISISGFKKFEKPMFVVATTIAILLFIHALVSIQSIPIVEILKAGSNEALAAEATINKESLFKESIGINNYLWNLNRQIFFPLVVIYLFSKYFETKTRKDLLIFLLFLILGVLNNSISGSLAPVGLLFFMLGICFIYLSKNIKTKHYIIVGLLSILFPIFVDYSASDYSISESSQITLEKTLYRFTGETFKRSLDYFNVYGVSEPFLGGRTHKIFTYFSGESFFNVSNHIFVQNLPERKLFYASTGHQNAHFICYMFADFGFFGIVLSSFLIGFLISQFQIICARLIDNKLSFAAYVILVTLFWKLMGVHPFTILFSHGALLLIALVIYLHYISRRSNAN